MFVGCDECAQLWREYAEAISAHLQIEDRLERATIARDARVVAVLTPQCKAAAETRQVARDAIRIHESSSHKGQMSAEA
jgi:hypothetical protein